MERDVERHIKVLRCRTAVRLPGIYRNYCTSKTTVGNSLPSPGITTHKVSIYNEFAQCQISVFRYCYFSSRRVQSTLYLNKFQQNTRYPPSLSVMEPLLLLGIFAPKTRFWFPPQPENLHRSPGFASLAVEICSSHCSLCNAVQRRLVRAKTEAHLYFSCIFRIGIAV